MKRYKTILIDPPWYEKGAGKIKRGADRHYPLMKTNDIILTILESDVWIPDNDSHLYLWVTNNFLPDGLRVMEALKYRYITNLVWVKNRFGLGQYFRGQHELCLFGVRGKLMTKTKKIPTVINASKTIHSRKPIELYDIIEIQSYPPYLEMFARNTRKGWDSWGNEIC